MRLTSEARAAMEGPAAREAWGTDSRATLLLSHSYSLSTHSFHLPFCADTKREEKTTRESNSVQTSAFVSLLVDVTESVFSHS
jgi:hypothetical protein